MNKLIALSITAMILMSCGGSKKEESTEKEEETKTEEDATRQQVIDLDEEHLTNVRAVIDEGLYSYAEELIDKVHDFTDINEVPAAFKDSVYMLQGRVARLKEEKTEAAMEKVKGSFAKLKNFSDEYSSTAIYKHPNTTQYVNVSSEHLFFSYDPKTEEPGPLYFKLQYVADNWLFMDEVKFNINGNIYAEKLNVVERDNSDGDIYEWCTLRVEDVPGLHKLFAKIIKNNGCKVRYIGDKYYGDRTISSQEAAAMKTVLMAYVEVGGYYEDINLILE